MLDDRLKELEDETRELETYKAADRERRALEYLIWSMEKADAVAKFNALEQARAENAEQARGLHEAVNEAHDKYAFFVN